MIQRFLPSVVIPVAGFLVMRQELDCSESRLHRSFWFHLSNNSGQWWLFSVTGIILVGKKEKVIPRLLLLCARCCADSVTVASF